MTIFQLECFCALADSLNFTQTANAMFITQPALSRAISSLEQDFSSFLKQDENRYQEYLKTMAHFHKYSVNNTMLIFL
mgnify:CR=1 FL=1